MCSSDLEVWRYNYVDYGASTVFNGHTYSFTCWYGFELFIASGPELGHMRTPVKSPGANGPTERGLGTWEHERLYLDAIDDALDLVARAKDYRTEYNTVHPRETTALNQPLQLRRRA